MNTNNTTEKWSGAAIDRPIFRTDKHNYSWNDVLSFSSFLNTLDDRIRDLKEGLAAQYHAVDTGDSLAREDLQNAANEWRYEFNLITGEETEEWFSQFDLNLDNLNSFLSRRLWRSIYSRDLNTIVNDSSVAVDQIVENLWPEIVFGNELGVIVSPLVWRAVARDCKIQTAIANADEVADAKTRFCSRGGIESDALDAYLEGSLFLRNTFEDCLHLDAIYYRCIDQYAHLDKCEMLLKSIRPQMVRIDFESVSFESFQLAKEALFCVNVDGDTLVDVASISSGSYSRVCRFLDEIDMTARQSLFSAAIGDCVGPLTGNENEFIICRILDKVEPNLDDPQVLDRIRKRYIIDILEPLVDSQVQWEICRLPIV